jgi:hypothetical protein
MESLSGCRFGALSAEAGRAGTGRAGVAVNKPAGFWIPDPGTRRGGKFWFDEIASIFPSE